MFFHTGNPPATGTGTLQITLEDVNDNAPYIKPTLAKVCDDAKDLRVVVLEAKDDDLHPNTDPFKFELSKQAVPDKVWKITKINSKSCIIIQFLGLVSPFSFTILGGVLSLLCFKPSTSTIQQEFCRCGSHRTSPSPIFTAVGAGGRAVFDEVPFRNDGLIGH